MKRLIATLLLSVLSVLSALPAAADHRQAPYERLVRWAQCTATFVTSDEVPVLRSYYDSVEHTLYIGTAELPGLSQELAEIVLFHEIGHCLQEQAGLFRDLPTIVTELDADRWAADLACALDRDGKRLLHDFFVWAKQTFGYDGDPDHGTLAQRTAQGDNAAMCKLARPR